MESWTSLQSQHAEEVPVVHSMMQQQFTVGCPFRETVTRHAGFRRYGLRDFYGLVNASYTIIVAVGHRARSAVTGQDLVRGSRDVVPGYRKGASKARVCK
jgi:hypothetical protein